MRSVEPGSPRSGGKGAKIQSHRSYQRVLQRLILRGATMRPHCFSLKKADEAFARAIVGCLGVFFVSPYHFRLFSTEPSIIFYSKPAPSVRRVYRSPAETSFLFKHLSCLTLSFSRSLCSSLFLYLSLFLCVFLLVSFLSHLPPISTSLSGSLFSQNFSLRSSVCFSVLISFSLHLFLFPSISLLSPPCSLRSSLSHRLTSPIPTISYKLHADTPPSILRNCGANSFPYLPAVLLPELLLFFLVVVTYMKTTVNRAPRGFHPRRVS